LAASKPFRLIVLDNPAKVVLQRQKSETYEQNYWLPKLHTL